MTNQNKVVNLPTATVAPITNVAMCSAAMTRAIERSGHLPGMVTLYGPSGWGKSTAAGYTANKLHCYYVECKSSWTRKALLIAILKEMGIQPAKTLYEMTDQVSEQLVLSGRPLIIDEMDHIVDKKATEIVRDIYEGSHAAILLVGEEQLPSKLKAWERFHGRMLEWIPAQPASIDDASHLARLYCGGVEISTDLLAKVHELSHGSVRRIAVNLDMIRAEAGKAGWMGVDLATWGTRAFYTGEAPKRRV